MAEDQRERPPLQASNDSDVDSDAYRDLFDACRNGNLREVKKLVTSANVNVRDTSGRKSSPLHFAAGGGLFVFISLG